MKRQGLSDIAPYKQSGMGKTFENKGNQMSSYLQIKQLRTTCSFYGGGTMPPYFQTVLDRQGQEMEKHKHQISKKSNVKDDPYSFCLGFFSITKDSYPS